MATSTGQFANGVKITTSVIVRDDLYVMNIPAARTSIYGQPETYGFLVLNDANAAFICAINAADILKIEPL